MTVHMLHVYIRECTSYLIDIGHKCVFLLKAFLVGEWYFIMVLVKLCF